MHQARLYMVLTKHYLFSTKDSVDHPISLYAATKKSNELMAHTYSHLFNIPTTGLRFSQFMVLGVVLIWLYLNSPGQHCAEKV